MRELRERTCCDGLCARGYSCPAFAPGVVDGPYRRPTWWRRALRAAVHFIRHSWSCQ